MNPDAYMPVYFRDLFEAVKGWPPATKWAYFVGLCYYWGHNHCKGLRNDSEFLRGVCEVERLDWPCAMDLIFDNDKCFTLGADGLWHQKRAEEEWIKSKAAIDQRSNAGKKGMASRWGRHRTGTVSS